MPLCNVSRFSPSGCLAVYQGAGPDAEIGSCAGNRRKHSTVKRSFLACAALLLVAASGAVAEPARTLSRSEVPAAVEAELSTRDILCGLDDLGRLVIPEGALG